MRETVQATLVAVAIIILIRWMTRPALNAFDVFQFVLIAIVMGAILYASWPRWKGPRAS
jgi:hypothetical protein